MRTNASTSVPVLVLDTKPSHFEHLRPLVRAAGEEAVLASTESEALEQLSRREHAAVLVDAHTPELDGVQAALHIRQLREGRRVPIIFLDSDEEDMERVLRIPDLKPVDFVHRSSPPEMISAKISFHAEVFRYYSEAERTLKRHTCIARVMDSVDELAIVTLDTRGVVTDWGVGAQRIYRYAPDEILGKHFSLLFTAEDRGVDAPGRELRIAEAVGKTDYEYWHRRKDGQPVYLTGCTTLLRTEDGVPCGFVKVCRDETRSKKAQQALAESEERYRMVALATTDVIYDWNMTTNEVLWNEAMASVFGYAPADYEGDVHWWLDHLHPDDRPWVARRLEDSISGGVAGWRVEYRFRRSDGSYAFVTDTARFVRDAQGRALRMIGAMIDVTERRRAEEELRRARDMALEASFAKSRFLATMSHELRSPLTAIIGYAELLDEELHELGLKDLKPDLDKIRAASDHLLTVISDILDISKIEAGKMELLVEEFDLAATVEEAVSTVRPLAEKADLRLRIEFECADARMVADQTRVRQILINLLSNAVKFTPSGEIETACSRITDMTGQDWFVLTIRDTGIGMSSDQLRMLFRSYGQLDATSTRRYGGTGLGLAITKHLTELMGGSIGVESEPGRGTTFTLRLPTAVAAGAHEEERVRA